MGIAIGTDQGRDCSPLAADVLHEIAKNGKTRGGFELFLRVGARGDERNGEHGRGNRMGSHCV